MFIIVTGSSRFELLADENKHSHLRRNRIRQVILWYGQYKADQTRRNKINYPFSIEDLPDCQLYETKFSPSLRQVIKSTGMIPYIVVNNPSGSLVPTNFRGGFRTTVNGGDNDLAVMQVSYKLGISITEFVASMRESMSDYSNVDTLHMNLDRN